MEPCGPSAGLAGAPGSEWSDPVGRPSPATCCCSSARSCCATTGRPRIVLPGRTGARAEREGVFLAWGVSTGHRPRGGRRSRPTLLEEAQRSRAPEVYGGCQAAQQPLHWRPPLPPPLGEQVSTRVVTLADRGLVFAAHRHQNVVFSLYCAPLCPSLAGTQGHALQPRREAAPHPGASPRAGRGDTLSCYTKFTVWRSQARARLLYGRFQEPAVCAMSTKVVTCPPRGAAPLLLDAVRCLTGELFGCRRR